MPTYPTRTATKIGTVTKDFTVSQSITGPFDTELMDGAYNGGYQTSGVNAFELGAGGAPHTITLYAATEDAQALEISTQQSSTPAYRPALIGEHFILTGTTNIPREVYGFHYSPQSDAPGTYPIVGGTSGTVDMSLSPGPMPDNYPVPFYHSSGLFTFGLLHKEDLTANGEVAAALISENGTLDGLYNAFAIDDMTVTTPWDYMASYAGSTANYTYIGIHDGTGWHFMSEWQLSAYGGAYNYTNYFIELSDPADDAIFQQLIYSYPGDSGFLSNGQFFIFSFLDNFPATSMTAFAFNEDMTEYTRYDIITDGTLGEAVFFIDQDGNFWLQGYDDLSGDMLSYFLPGSGPIPPEENAFDNYSMSTVFSLPCFTPCVPFAIRRF